MPLFRVMPYYMFFQLYGTLSIASCHNGEFFNFPFNLYSKTNYWI